MLDIRAAVEIPRAKPPKSIPPRADPRCLRVKHAIPPGRVDPRIISTGIPRDRGCSPVNPYFGLN